MHFKRIVLMLLTGLMACTAWATPTATPTGFRIAIYSSTTAELFWNRPATPGLHYEITRDDLLLDETDGVSLMDRTFIKGVAHNYTVVAINQGGERSAPATLTIGDTTSPGDNGPTGDAPGKPTGLRADIYSSTAAELFWNRPLTPGLLYDVFKDSVLLKQTDGVSFFDRNFDRSKDSLYQVVAIGSNGARSEPSSITVGGNSPLPPDNPGTDDPNPGDGPSAPTFARIDVYSNTTAEVFWDRPQTDERVVSTEVLRNGELLGSTPGVSFYDDQRAPGQTYVYTLTAIDADGKRSEPSTVAFDRDQLFNRDPGRILEDLQHIIYQNASVQANRSVSELLLSDNESPEDRTVGESSLVMLEDGPFVIRTPVTCNRGGSYTIDSIDGGPMTSLIVDQCILGDLFDETYHGSVFINPSTEGVTIIYDKFSMEQLRFSLTIEKGQAIKFTFRGENTTTETLSDFSYTEVTDGGGIRVTDMNLSMKDASAEVPRTSLEVSFNYSSPATSNRPVSVTTTETFRDGDSGNGYASGRMYLDDNAGAAMQIDASVSGRDYFWVSSFYVGGGRGTRAEWGSDFQLPCTSIAASRGEPLEGCLGYFRSGKW